MQYVNKKLLVSIWYRLCFFYTTIVSKFKILVFWVSIHLRYLLTSHHNGGGLLGRVSYIVAGHAAVDPCLVWGDGWKGECATLHHAPLWQAVITADPGESGGRFPTCGDAHQGYCLAGIHHDRILHQQLDGRGGCGGKASREALAQDDTHLSSSMSVPHLLRHL